jgi:hypothetical protein
MANHIRALLADMRKVMYNPSLLQDAVLDTLTAVNDGEDIEILDPNNPVVFSIEAAATLAQASIEQGQKVLRRRNAVMATEWEDLYGHMSDRDTLGRFAQPARTTIALLIGKDEVMNKAMPRDHSGVRKLVIPTDTEIIVAGHPFTLQYPIEFRVMPYGGIQVIYDTSVQSPIRELSSNTLDWRMASVPYDGRPIDTMIVQIPVLQYRITPFTDVITEGVSWRHRYQFEDQYFTARVWVRERTTWKEIGTTHSIEVIDPLKPTAQLQVLNNELQVHIPDVYVRTGLVRGDVRVDIYTTRGKVELDLSKYEASDYQFVLRDLSGRIDRQFYTPLNTFSQLSMMSADQLRGGRPALTFMEFRDRVIDNSFGARKLPVSEKQLETALADEGFSVVKSIDYVTERIYLASIDMPESTIPGLSTAIGTMNGIVTASVATLATLDTVKDNGKRLTILPSTLYRYQNGEVTLDTVGGLGEYLRMEANQLVAEVNANTLLYTPFHYVLDINGEIAESRPYYLSSPAITNKRFNTTNETLALEVSTDTYNLEPHDRGYRLLIKTKSDKTYRSLKNEQCHVQISFTPRGYVGQYAYLDGTYVGTDPDGERVFEFILDTNLDIDRNHDLIVTNFIMVGDSVTPIPMPLNVNMNVIYSVSDYTTPDYRAVEVDRILRSRDFGAKAATHEELRFDLGSHLGALWANTRTVAGTLHYVRHEEDVYDTYAEDVYERDEVLGTHKYTIETVDGKPVVKRNLLHKKGDPVLKNGEPVVLHQAGDVVLGSDGKPIIAQPRKVLRRMEMFLMDAKFLISQTQETQEYRKMVEQQLLKYILVDIPSVDTRLLEKTSLYFFPKTTMGMLDVLLGDGNITKLPAETRFSIRYYLTGATRQNGDFLNALAETTRSAIKVNLRGQTISASAITAEIRRRLGDEIIDVEMDGIGEGQDIFIFSMKDPSARPAIGKKLSVNPDWSVSIRDDISIAYNRHDVTA